MQNLSVEFKMTFTLGDQVLKGKTNFFKPQLIWTGPAQKVSDYM